MQGFIHGGRWQLWSGRTRLAAALVVGLLASVLLLLALDALSRQQLEASRWVNHTLEVLERTATLDADLAMAASEGRGFIVDRSADSVARFEAAARQVGGDVADLRALTADNPAEQSEVNRLDPLIAARVTALRDVIGHLQASDEKGAMRVVLTQNGRALMDQILAVTGRIEAEERRLLAHRSAAAHDAARLMLAGLLACGIVLTASGVSVVALLAGRARAHEHMASLRRLNGSLEERVAARTAALAASEARQRTYFKHLADGVIAIRVEPDGRLVYEQINAAAGAMLDLGKEIIGREPREVLPETVYRLAEPSLHQCIAEGAPVRFSRTHESPEGPRELRYVVAPVRAAPAVDHPEGRVALLLISVRDVTHEVALEAQLRQSQRMEAVGQLTAGLAHDFNNLMQAILGGLEVLREQSGLNAEGRDCVAVTDGAAQRAATLAHRLLAFSRKQVLEPTLIRPDEALANMAALLARTLGGRIRVETTTDGAVWPVHVDATQLDNCVFNLALNARDAMPGGGRLRLLAENAGPDAAQAAGLPPGDYVRLAVEDAGTGMSPQTLARALEPFFTTKPVGEGTGLGLSMVQGFARQSGGDIRIRSAPGQGTTVSLWLPRASGATFAPSTRRPTPGELPAFVGRRRVLVVDDERTVRWSLSLFLTKAGLTPVEAESGEAALERLRAGEAYDLLLTDQSMPGMTGCELIQEAMKLRPDLPTLLVTGYDRVAGLEQIRGRVTVLNKPFDRATFIRQVHALLGTDGYGTTEPDDPEGEPFDLAAGAGTPNVVQLRSAPATRPRMPPSHDGGHR